MTDFTETDLWGDWWEKPKVTVEFKGRGEAYGGWLSVTKEMALSAFDDGHFAARKCSWLRCKELGLEKEFFHESTRSAI